MDFFCTSETVPTGTRSRVRLRADGHCGLLATASDSLLPEFLRVPLRRATSHSKYTSLTDCQGNRDNHRSTDLKGCRSPESRCHGIAPEDRGHFRERGWASGTRHSLRSPFWNGAALSWKLWKLRARCAAHAGHVTGKILPVSTDCVFGCVFGVYLLRGWICAYLCVSDVLFSVFNI